MNLAMRFGQVCITYLSAVGNQARQGWREPVEAESPVGWVRRHRQSERWSNTPWQATAASRGGCDERRLRWRTSPQCFVPDGFCTGIEASSAKGKVDCSWRLWLALNALSNGAEELPAERPRRKPLSARTAPCEILFGDPNYVVVAHSGTLRHGETSPLPGSATGQSPRVIGPSCRRALPMPRAGFYTRIDPMPRGLYRNGPLGFRQSRLWRDGVEKLEHLGAPPSRLHGSSIHSPTARTKAGVLSRLAGVRARGFA